MRFNKFIISVLMISACFNSNAQEIVDKKNTVYFDFTALMTPPNRLSFGYIRNFGTNYFAGIELGHSIDRNNGRSNGNSKDYQLFAYRLQVGYNFNPEERFQNYVSLDFQQIHHTETLIDDYFRSSELSTADNTVYYSYDEIEYKREKMTFNVNYGFFAHFNKAKTFGINPSVGLGLKVVDVTFSNPVNLNIDDDDIKFWDFGSRYRKEGQETTVNANIQVKFFYKF